jgi:multiple sugar transport system permease protein
VTTKSQQGPPTGQPSRPAQPPATARPTDARPTDVRPRRRPIGRALSPWLWLAPCLALIAGTVLYPVVAVVQSALTRYNEFGYSLGFAGAGNLARVFAEPALSQVVWNTVRWVVVVVGVTVVVSMALAQFLSTRFVGRRVVRWSLIVPWAASLVMTSVVWRYIYDNYYGYLNRVLLDLHLVRQPIAWTVDPRFAPWSLAFLGIVVSVPFTTYVLLAGLQSVDGEVYEAARMDGAGPLQTYFRVTVPLLRPSLTLAVVLNTIYVFNSFPIIWVLTGSQPGYGDDTLVTFMYKIAFKTDLDIGESAALALFNVGVTLVLALVPLGLTNRRTRATGTSVTVAERPDARRSRRPAVLPGLAGLLMVDLPVPAWWRRARHVVLPLTGLFVVLFFLTPYVVMALSSFKSDKDLFASPARYLPSHWLFSNWAAAFRFGDLSVYFRNSAIIAVAGTVLVLLVATPAAYATARKRFRGRSLLMGVVLVTQMFAPVALVIGIYREWLQVGLSDSLIALTVTDAGFNLAFAVWILNGSFASIPGEIEEAARLDGLSDLRILLRIALPLARPGVVTAAIFTFISIWNEFVVGLTISSTPKSEPLTVGINSFIGQYQVHYQYLFVVSLVAIVPVVALFIVIERSLVGGLTAGAVK